MMHTSSVSALLADVQRASVHDGPGLRTTIFLKGCQLRCAWCHNPETIAFAPQQLFYPEKCIGCGQCSGGCFAGARVECGYRMTVEEVLAIAAQDKPYYGKDGGITLSGGEPLCQPAFTLALLRKAKAQGMHTALESNVCLPTETLLPALKLAHLLMADLKLWDSTAHQHWTGRGNQQVLQNLQAASRLGLPLILRTPIVPGVNDKADEIRAISRFAASLNTLQYYELLAYHPLGLGKANALGLPVQRFAQPKPTHLHALAAIAAEQGIPVRIGGVPFS